MDNNILAEKVIIELNNIRLYAKKSELDNLSMVAEINANHEQKCIYGVMTGNCFSSRAHYLINKCCQEVVLVVGRRFESFTDKKEFPKDSCYSREFFSPVEIFLWVASEKDINSAVCFLRGSGPLKPFNTEDWNHLRNNDEVESSIVKITCQA